MDERKLRIAPHFGMMMLSVLLLWNPHINVIDVLPDCIAWLLAALAMTSLAYVNDEIATARRYAWILFGITTVKLIPMAFSVLGPDVLNAFFGTDVFKYLGEPVAVLLYSCCFGIAEMALGIYVIGKWLSAISQIGLMHESPAAIRGVDYLRLMNVIFFMVRVTASILPELVYLRSTEYLGNVIYGVVIDIRDYRPYLIVFFSFIAFIIGVVYACIAVRYLRGLLKELPDGAFGAAIRALEDEKQEELRCRSILERFTVAFSMMIVGAVFLCHLSFENVNVLPDFVGVALLVGAVAILATQIQAPPAFYRIGIVSAVLMVPYYIVRVWHGVVHHGFWASNIIDYFRRNNIPLSPEKQAEKMGLQLEMLLFAIIETAILVYFFRLFMKQLGHLNSLTRSDGVTLYDSMTRDMMKFEKEKYEKQPKTVFVWFCISAGMEVLRALPVFSFVVTPIAFVRMIVNVIFVWVFMEYLSALKKEIVYHYRYNGSTETA